MRVIAVACIDMMYSYRYQYCRYTCDDSGDAGWAMYVCHNMRHALAHSVQHDKRDGGLSIMAR